ncbi:hypothetical protein [Natronorubrum sp. A-ect3]
MRGTAVAGSVGIAGCLERLGFEEQSTWSSHPSSKRTPSFR